MNFKKEIKEKIIATAENKLKDVVSDFIELKRSGKELTGKCPFCGSTKAFKVSPTKDIYKCFNCPGGGKGAIDFLMKAENKSYPDALKYIADKYSVDIGAQISLKKNNKRSFC